ncbi:hypothetical protein [Salipiger abyssi]|uniref:hypothetical protein n=1 Tax=Salipiger abyssi TaxID=1250539 RepID=UPI0040598A7E
MFVKCNSTRHTVIGTLRRNHVYRLDDKSPKARRVVKTLTAGKRPVLSELSAEEAEKTGAQAIGLVYAEDVAPSGDDAEAGAQIAALTSQIEELTGQLDAAAADREKIAAERDALAKQIAELSAAPGADKA